MWVIILLLLTCCRAFIRAGSVMSDSLQSTSLLCLWNFLGKNSGESCYFLLQGNFPIQGLNPCLLKSPFPSPRDLPSPGIEPRFPALQTDFFIIWATRGSPKSPALGGGFFTTVPPGKSWNLSIRVFSFVFSPKNSLFNLLTSDNNMMYLEKYSVWHIQYVQYLVVINSPSKCKILLKIKKK